MPHLIKDSSTGHLRKSNIGNDHLGKELDAGSLWDPEEVTTHYPSINDGDNINPVIYDETGNILLRGNTDNLVYDASDSNMNNKEVFRGNDGVSTGAGRWIPYMGQRNYIALPFTLYCPFYTAISTEARVFKIYLADSSYASVGYVSLRLDGSGMALHSNYGGTQRNLYDASIGLPGGCAAGIKVGSEDGNHTLYVNGSKAADSSGWPSTAKYIYQIDVPENGGDISWGNIEFLMGTFETDANMATRTGNDQTYYNL